MIHIYDLFVCKVELVVVLGSTWKTNLQATLCPLFIIAIICFIPIFVVQCDLNNADIAKIALHTFYIWAQTY